MQLLLKISEYSHNGRLQARVYFPKDSPAKPKGGYKWYKSRAAAEAAIAENNALQKRYGDIAKNVSLSELVEARQAKNALIGTGLTLLDAARQVKLALDAALESKSVSYGLNAYLDDVRTKFEERKKNNPRCEPRHWRSVKRTLARLEYLTDFSLRELNSDHLRACLKGLTKSSLKAHLRNLHAAFEYCIDAGWMDENPAQALRRMKADRPSKSRTNQTFTLTEVRTFLLAIAEESPQAVPYFAICFFAGVRPEAAFKMKWNDVSENGYLYVPHNANKSGHAYNVEILPILRKWLEWWECRGYVREGDILPFSVSTLKRIRKQAMGKAGILAWIQDGTRKTFATAYRGTFKCKVRTSAALGHKGTTVLDEHYDSRLMTEREAEEYWQIIPPKLEEGLVKEVA